MSALDNVFAMKKEFETLGLIMDQSFPAYECTPENAMVMGHIGCDGIHFCIVKSDQTLEQSPVYVVSPMMPGHEVALIAPNLETFVNLVVQCKDASILESMSYTSAEVFEERVKCIHQEIDGDLERRDQVKEAIRRIKGCLPL